MPGFIGSTRDSRRGALRVGLAVLVVASLGVLGAGYWSKSVAAEDPTSAVDWHRAVETGEPVAPRRDGITVVTTQASPNNKGQLIAFGPDGAVLYYNDTYNVYFDVDPSPRGSATVVYVATRRLNQSECSAQTYCGQNVVERVNLTTGEVTQLYSYVVPDPQRLFFGHGISRWHDVDRLDGSRLLIGDISNDRVLIVNSSTGVTEWQWEVIEEYPPSSGGNYPYDWAHVNDVEALDDGRIMVSLRNQDQVVFIDRQRGLVEDWTLGMEDDYDTLYEQHNPDYIPADRGGPAVLLADSENNRVTEFRRVDGQWNRTWTWQDETLQWPRDVDRLPNGHSLIVDSHGDRVVEIDRSGEVVWSVPVALAYDVERLGTGDESAGGQSATALGLQSRVVTARSPGGGETSAEVQAGFIRRLRLGVKSLVPNKLVNAVVFVVPQWMDFYEVIATVVLLGAAVAWTLLELWWSPRIELRSPVRFGQHRR